MAETKESKESAASVLSSPEVPLHEVTVLFFASARERAGTGEATVSIPKGSNVRHLVGVLSNRFQKLNTVLGTSSIAVNEEYAEADTVIPPRAEVAVIPPVSGG